MFALDIILSNNNLIITFQNLLDFFIQQASATRGNVERFWLVAYRIKGSIIAQFLGFVEFAWYQVTLVLG